MAPDKCVRPGRHGPAALERVLAVVQAEAEDPLWRGYGRTEIPGRVLVAVPVLQTAGGVQRGRADRDEGTERREARVAGRVGDVDVTALRPDVQARAVRRGEGREPHEPGLLARVAWAWLGCAVL